jgi:protein involved in polysaccharide export with SLBB domain
MGICFPVMIGVLASCGSLQRIPVINKAGMLGNMSIKVFSGAETPPATQSATLPELFTSGDRLKMSVYEGVRSADRVARVDGVVGESGEIEFDRIGIIPVAGQTPAEVERSIKSAALRSERGLGVHFTIHLESWNQNPVIDVRGEVPHPRLLILPKEGMSPASAIGMTGGLAGAGRLVLVRRGEKRPILIGSRDFETLELKAGDQLVVE